MSNKNKGILCILASAFGFAMMNTFVKLAGDLPSFQKSFFRNLIALIVALIILLHDKQKFSFKKDNLKYLILRSALGTVGILCNYYAIDHMILSDATMLGKLSPFFAIIFSFFFLSEKMTVLQTISVIVAFIGSLFIIKPNMSMEIVPALIGTLGAMGAGGAYTAVRYLGKRGERGPFIVFFFSLFSTLVTLPYILFNYHAMTLKQLGLLILAGLSATIGQFGVTNAYKYAAAKEISIFDYSQVLFAALMSILLFSQYPDKFSIIGYIVICGISIFMFFYNNKNLTTKRNN